MKGFFNLTYNQLPYKSEKGVLSCVSCGLHKNAKHPKMKPWGEFKKEIMIIGEAPGEREDVLGKPWQGRAGSLLKKKYREFGIDIEKDCLSLNAVNCRPENNTTPTEYQIACCRKRVINIVKKLKPKIIILHGQSALESLIGHKWNQGLGGILKWSGFTIPDHEFNCWLCPTFHPSFVLRQEEENEVEVLWRFHIQRALECSDKKLPKKRSEKNITLDYNGIPTLKQIYRDKPKLLAFDIETTGLKPYNTDSHQIISISFCYEKEKAHAIPFPQKGPGVALLKRILEHPSIGKIAANMKYEDTWLKVLHDIKVNNWVFDTMQASHILDNRPGITGLKFQAFVNFGIVGYDDEVSPYLKAGGPNETNNIKKLIETKTGFEKLLIYNGLDSLLEFHLAEKQMKRLGLV